MGGSEKGRRVAWVDIAKGFAIICVVLGHMGGSGIPEVVIQFCFSFHMPLFFMLSGYFLKPTARLDRPFVEHSARALLVPYALTSAACILLAGAAAGVTTGIATIPEAMGRYTLAALYGAGAVTYSLPPGIIPIGAIWFLWGLFWARLFVAAAQQTKCPAVIVIGLFAAAYLIDEEAVWLPLSFQSGMMAALFVWLGQKLRGSGLTEPGAISPVVWVAMLFVWGYCIVYCGHLYMVETDFKDGLIDLVGALAGSMCVIKASQFVEAHAAPVAGALEKLGRNTLPVFCMHLVELNLFPYRLLFSVTGLFNVQAVPIWVLLLVVRVVVIAVLCAILWAMPRPISGAFYASRKA